VRTEFRQSQPPAPTSADPLSIIRDTRANSARSVRSAVLLPALSLFGCLALAGCGHGDFGEVSPYASREDMHDWLGYDALAGTAQAPSRFPLTADERRLRDLAYPLVAPAYRRLPPLEFAGNYGLLWTERRGHFDPSDYTTHLFVDARRSPEAMYAQLIDDVRNDTTRLPQFFETAGTVLDLDRKRRKSLFYIANLSPAERDNALRRMSENAGIVDMVRESLAQRIASYRFALGRLVAMAPNPQAAEADRAIERLRERTASYRRLPPPFARERSLADAR
jgi:hypothetical protein